VACVRTVDCPVCGDLLVSKSLPQRLKDTKFHKDDLL